MEKHKPETIKKFCENRSKSYEEKYGKERAKEIREQQSIDRKGKPSNRKGRNYGFYFNNGEIEKVCFECPPGFQYGRLKYKRKNQSASSI